MRNLTFKQGIHPEYNKQTTRDMSLRKAKRPSRVMIPLQQHIGAPCQALVEKGDHVDRGQKIGDTDSFVSAPVHASVSGVVKGIDKIQSPGGDQVEAVIIEADAEDTPAENFSSRQDYTDLRADEIIDIVREAGITGMGGAMFPTHIKLSVPADKDIDTFMINGAECEPYLNVDYRMMVERSHDLLLGMKVMMKVIGAEKGLICIEDNKPQAITRLQELAADEPQIEVKVFATKYPQGGEKMLIEAALGREVPMGGLPLDVGVVVHNVSTTIAVLEAVRDGKPLIERAATVAGDGIKEPCNLIYRIGTPVSDLIAEAGGYKGESGDSGEPGQVIIGGPMMGVAQPHTDIPLVKGSSGVLVFPRNEVKDFSPLPCIKCGRCVDVCPTFLMPVQLANFTKHDMYDELEDYNILNCIECGCCSYICPSNRPLLHNIKIGKAEVTARKRDNNE